MNECLMSGVEIHGPFGMGFRVWHIADVWVGFSTL